MPLSGGYYYPIIEKSVSQGAGSSYNYTIIGGSGSVIQGYAGEDIQISDFVYLSVDSEFFVADSRSLESCNVVGISLENVLSGSNVQIFSSIGFVVNLYSNLIAGKRYFLDINGSLTNTPLHNVVQVGTAISTSSLIFNPSFVMSI